MHLHEPPAEINWWAGLAAPVWAALLQRLSEVGLSAQCWASACAVGGQMFSLHQLAVFVCDENCSVLAGQAPGVWNGFVRLDASETAAPEVEGGHSIPQPSLLAASQPCSKGPVALWPKHAEKTVAMVTSARLWQSMEPRDTDHCRWSPPSARQPCWPGAAPCLQSLGFVLCCCLSLSAGNHPDYNLVSCDIIVISKILLGWVHRWAATIPASRCWCYTCAAASTATEWYGAMGPQSWLWLLPLQAQRENAALWPCLHWAGRSYGGRLDPEASLCSSDEERIPLPLGPLRHKAWVGSFPPSSSGNCVSLVDTCSGQERAEECGHCGVEASWCHSTPLQQGRRTALSPIASVSFREQPCLLYTPHTAIKCIWKWRKEVLHGSSKDH